MSCIFNVVCDSGSIARETAVVADGDVLEGAVQSWSDGLLLQDDGILCGCDKQNILRPDGILIFLARGSQGCTQPPNRRFR